MRPIYVHSPHRDFAETERVPEAAYLGRRVRRSELKLLACPCEQPVLMRIRRSLWMRFAPFFRHYLCRACGDRVLRTRVRQRWPYCAVYLPPSPASAELTKRLRQHYARLLQGREQPARGEEHAAHATFV